jgi:hypothetical protein
VHENFSSPRMRRSLYNDPGNLLLRRSRRSDHCLSCEGANPIFHDPFPAWGYPWTPLVALIGSLVYLALNIGFDFKNVLLALAFVALSYRAFLLAMHFRAGES